MKKVKLTITESRCRSGCCKAGDEFLVEDLCPPLCHELWNMIYPYVFALQNGAELDYGNCRSRQFDVPTAAESASTEKLWRNRRQRGTNKNEP